MKKNKGISASIQKELERTLKASLDKQLILVNKRQMEMQRALKRMADGDRPITKDLLAAAVGAPKKYAHKSFYYDPTVDERVKEALTSKSRAQELEAAGVEAGNWNALMRKLQEDWVAGKIRLTPAK